MDFLKSFSSIFKNSKGLTELGIGTIVTNIIGAIFWLFLAGVLGTEKYGELSYYIATAVIGSRIALLGTPNSILVFGSKGEDIVKPLVFFALISSLITGIIFFLVFSFNPEISLYVVGFVIFSIISSILLSKKQYTKYMKIIIVQKIILVILSLIFYKFFDVNGIILGMGLSFFIFSIFFYRNQKIKFNFNIIKKRKNFLINSFVLDLSETLVGSLDKILIAPILGFILLGNYQLGIQFFSILLILPNTIFQYILPHDATGNHNMKIKKLIILLSIIFAITNFIVSPILIPLFFSEFMEAIEIIKIMGFAIIPATIALILISEFLGSVKIKNVMIGSAIYLFVQILGIIILTQYYGIKGAAISIVIAYSLQALSLWLLSKNK